MKEYVKEAISCLIKHNEKSVLDKFAKSNLFNKEMFLYYQEKKDYKMMKLCIKSIDKSILITFIL